MVDRMRAMRRPGESYSEVILRLVELETSGVGWLRGFAASKGFRLRRQLRIRSTLLTGP